MSRDELMHRIELALLECDGAMTWNDVVDLATARQAQIFANDEAVIATRIAEYPQFDVLDCMLAAGSLKGIWALEAEVEAFAKRQGCVGLMAHGRPGWGRTGRRAGWKLHSMMFTKRLGLD